MIKILVLEVPLDRVKSNSFIVLYHNTNQKMQSSELLFQILSSELASAAELGR